MCRDLGFVRGGGGGNPKFWPQGGGTREPPPPLNTYEIEASDNFPPNDPVTDCQSFGTALKKQIQLIGFIFSFVSIETNNH